MQVATSGGAPLTHALLALLTLYFRPLMQVATSEVIKVLLSLTLYLLYRHLLLWCRYFSDAFDTDTPLLLKIQVPLRAAPLSLHCV